MVVIAIMIKAAMRAIFFAEVVAMVNASFDELNRFAVVLVFPV
jgi:hypothetical protein